MFKHLTVGTAQGQHTGGREGYYSFNKSAHRENIGEIYTAASHHYIHL